MEEKKKDKSTKIIIVLLVIVIILLVAGYVVLFIMKDKLLEKNPPIVKTTTTTVETTGGEKTTEPTTKKVEELKNINQEYTDKLNEKVSVALSKSEKDSGVYHQLYVTGTKQEDITAVMQFFIGDASFAKMIDLRVEYPLYDPETENFDELLNQEANLILDYFSKAVEIHKVKDAKLSNTNYFVTVDDNYPTEISYSIYAFDKNFNLVKKINNYGRSLFNFEKNGKSVLKDISYEIKDNKVYYIKVVNCSGFMEKGNIEVRYAFFDNGSLKDELDKKYEFDYNNKNLEVYYNGGGDQCN